MQFSLVCYLFLHLRPKCFPQYPILEHPYKATGKIRVMYNFNVCIFRWQMGTQNVLYRVVAGILWKYCIVLNYKTRVSNLSVAKGQSRCCGLVRWPQMEA
jgi:hypothetical protein